MNLRIVCFALFSISMKKEVGILIGIAMNLYFFKNDHSLNFISTHPSIWNILPFQVSFSVSFFRNLMFCFVAMKPEFVNSFVSSVSVIDREH